MLRSGDKRAEVEISREKCSEVEIPELVEMCWKPEVGWPLERALLWREWGCIRGGAVGCRRGFLFAMYRNWLGGIGWCSGRVCVRGVAVRCHHQGSQVEILRACRNRDSGSLGEKCSEVETLRESAHK